MLNQIKTWLIGIVLGMVAVLGFISLMLRGAVRDREETIDRLKSEAQAAKVRDKATEALIRGVANENKPIKRGFFNTK